ncbi:MAG: glutathione S-transferase family protein [Wenzhouxiangellaceae bacterium]
MKLYGSYTSPFVRHCRIVLAQNDRSYELENTDYAASADQSPTCRVPFLTDGDLTLTDSASILRHLRQQAGQPFLADARQFDFFLLINTALDSSINLFLLEKDGITPDQSAYLKRQQRRVSQILDWMERALRDRTIAIEDDVSLRLGCFLSWVLFRQRLVLDNHPRLAEFQRGFEQDPVVAGTHPVRAP